jgi:hypothetical protein
MKRVAYKCVICLFVILAIAVPSAWGGSVAPVDAPLCASMKSHHVLNDGAPVGCERLAVVTFRYVDFAGAEHDDGRVVVLDAVAERVSRIFDELHARRFAIAKAQPMDAYDGNDEASMAADNTSGFNHRMVTGGTKISLHAYGAAIDLNPLENPFIERDRGNDAKLMVHPPAGAGYLNRMQQRPGKPVRAGMAEEAVAVFAANGFTVWGGYWDDPIDYQHFDIGRPLAEDLAKLPPGEARKRFEAAIAAPAP